MRKDGGMLFRRRGILGTDFSWLFGLRGVVSVIVLDAFLDTFYEASKETTSMTAVETGFS